MQGFDLIEPVSVAEACQLLRQYGEGTKLIGGGTALVVLMKQKVFQPERLISTRRIADLHVFEFDGAKGLRLGGGICHYDVEASTVVQEHYPLLAAAVHKVGNIRVRQMATLAGNLSHGDYMSDPPAALVALGAQVVLVSAEGSRELPLEAFILGPYATQLQPGEMLTEVRIPAPRRGAISHYLKFAIPSETERPTANVAVQAVPEGGVLREIALVLGAVAGRPVRLPEAEALLRGRDLTAALLAEAAEAAVADLEPVDDGRAPVWYKKDVARVLVRRALEEVVRQVQGAR